jgi:hypothetical protein
VTDPAPTESLHDFAYHVVKGGKERTITVKSGSPWPKSARFRNTLSAASLARIRVLVAASRELSVAMTTAEMTKLAGAESDVKGVLGALRILDVGGVIHATAGQRRQLIWNPGRRPAGSAPPRGADHARFMHLRDLLRQPTTPWLSTDYLIRHARFDPDLDTRDHYLDTGEEIRGERKRHERGLPVNFYRDSGKSARKYVLGALKALYWLERVAWSNYSPQAIQWRWVGPESTLKPLRRPPAPPVALKPDQDPYLDGTPQPDRRERVRQREFERWLAFEESRQRWIDAHYPKAARQYHYQQELRRRDAEGQKQKRERR